MDGIETGSGNRGRWIVSAVGHRCVRQMLVGDREVHDIVYGIFFFYILISRRSRGYDPTPIPKGGEGGERRSQAGACEGGTTTKCVSTQIPKYVCGVRY